MINSFELLTQLNDQINSSDLTSMQQKILASKYVDLLLSQLQPGDSIEGLIAKLGDNKYTLQVRPNVNIPIQMLEQLEIGKLMNFIVQGKEDGKLYLQPASSAIGQEIPLIQKTLEELSLPKTEGMKEVIDNFVQKHLPLAKDMLLKAYQASKSYDIPAKVITNLMEKQVFSPKELGTLSSLRANGINNIVTELKEIIMGLNSPKDLGGVLNTLKEGMPAEKLNQLAGELTNELAEPQAKETLSASNIKNPREAEAKGTEQIQTKDTKAASLVSDDLLKLINREGLKDAFDASPQTVLKKLIGKIYDETMMLHLDNMKNSASEGEKIYSSYHLLAKLMKTLDKADLSDKEKEYMNAVKEPIAMLGKLNTEAEYFMFPMLNDHKQTQAELYFFKPKKGTKKAKENMYIVLALSLPHIEQIEIHINKQEKNILLSINVESEEIQKHFKQYMGELNDSVEALGFSISKITWGLVNQKAKEQLLSQENLEYQLNHMDFKV